jgi:hypothetical protein
MAESTKTIETLIASFKLVCAFMTPEGRLLMSETLLELAREMRQAALLDLSLLAESDVSSTSLAARDRRL